MKATLITAASAVLLAQYTEAATCNFVRNTLQCPAVGAACTLFDVADSGSRVSSSGYTAGYCQITSGFNASNYAGIVATGPTFEAQYGSACSGTAQYPCQYADPSLLGEEAYPGLLTCNSGKCLVATLQETGDPCTAGSECLSGVCMNGVCQGLLNGQSCQLGGCAYGYYCNVGTCKLVTLPGDVCTTLAECSVGTICNLKAAIHTCTPLWSVSTGHPVNSADLCISGFMDADNNCQNAIDPSKIGNPCNCGETSPYPGVDCACNSNNICALKEHNSRSQAMVAARKVARTCTAKARAPDGTICQDPWINMGNGQRITDLGSCAYLKCHRELEAWYAAEGDIDGVYGLWDKNSICARDVFTAFYAASARGQIPCSLPAAWASFGWTCNTDVAPDSGLSGGAKAGIAFGILIPLGLIGYAGFLLYTGKAPHWLSNAASSASSGFSKITRRGPTYSNIGTSTSGSSVASAYIYSSGSTTKTPLTGSYGAA